MQLHRYAVTLSQSEVDQINPSPTPTMIMTQKRMTLEEGMYHIILL